MYTRCPKCETVFRITAAQLRVADGEVRCGNCTISFNALAALSDNLPELTDAVLFENNQDPGTAPDNDFISPATNHVDEDPQSEKTNPAEATLEFDAPEVSWSSFFVSSEPDGANKVEIDGADKDEPADANDSLSLDDDSEEEISPLERETGNPDEWMDFLSELNEDAVREDSDEGDARSKETVDGNDESRDEVGQENEDPTMDQPGMALAADAIAGEYFPESPADPENVAGAAENAAEPPLVIVEALPDFETDYDVSDEPEYASEAAFELAAESGAGEYLDQRADEFPALFDDISDDTEYALETDTAVPWRSLAVISLLGIAFLSQFLHYNRDSLATHPEYGGIVRNIYAWLGSPLYPDWDLDAFRVRGTEAVAGRSATSALDILATIEVVGTEPVGLPLVRIALHDRWSNPVGSRVFYPAEYLRANTEVSEILSGGTTLSLEVSVIDPGTEAQSYIIDVCVPSRSNGLQCQMRRDPFQS